MNVKKPDHLPPAALACHQLTLLCSLPIGITVSSGLGYTLLYLLALSSDILFAWNTTSSSLPSLSIWKISIHPISFYLNVTSSQKTSWPPFLNRCSYFHKCYKSCDCIYITYSSVQYITPHMITVPPTWAKWKFSIIVLFAIVKHWR